MKVRFPVIWIIAVISILLFWAVIVILSHDFIALFDYWEVMVTMIFGAFIAGASSEGGGAIAFPVFTLLLDFSPSLARNFSLAIQSVGMTSASIFIITSGIPILKGIIRLTLLGGILGFTISSLFLIDYVDPGLTKLLFVSVWLSFSFILLSANTSKSLIPSFKSAKQKQILFASGLVGGMLSAFFGNGIDIFTFSILTLYFGISEKLSTPTSVVLMAGLSIYGFGFNYFVKSSYTMETLEIWTSAIPVVILFAPLGALIISRVSKLIIRNILITIIIVQYVSALVILKPSASRFLLSLSISIIALIFFYILKLKREKI
jgi:uncharacterized membrane protein YfcA